MSEYLGEALQVGLLDVPWGVFRLGHSPLAYHLLLLEHHLLLALHRLFMLSLVHRGYQRMNVIQSIDIQMIQIWQSRSDFLCGRVLLARWTFGQPWVTRWESQGDRVEFW